MENPYLIQRAKFKKEISENKTGIDNLLNFDYMGSAEFEFGALPKSLKRVRENIGEYIQFQYSFNKFPSKVVTVFCKKDQEKEIPQILENLIEGKIRLKGFCDLKDWVNPGNFSFKYPNDFWWDIDNDFFFWKFTPEFDLKFKTALNK